MKYERRKIADLIPNAENPRKINAPNKSALAASLEHFGQVEPIVINDRTGQIVGGHQAGHSDTDRNIFTIVA